MSKSVLRLEAIKLRKHGTSVREIAIKLGVSKSTTSLWTRDIILTTKQREKLKLNSIKGAELGRIKGALLQKERRLKTIESMKQTSLDELQNLTNRELDIAGLCLYWSEGSKKQRRVSLCNSDPKIIQMYIKWLAQIYDITPKDLRCYVGINEAHRHREDDVKNYWSAVTKIPLSQFNKSSFKKYPLRKVYENFNEHYGTLTVTVRRPARIFYRILGKIHGLSSLAT